MGVMRLGKFVKNLRARLPLCLDGLLLAFVQSGELGDEAGDILADSVFG
jgi:hypothetical protein